MSQVILFGTTACLNEQRLRASLTTPWEIHAIPDEVNLAHLQRTSEEADALLTLSWNQTMRSAGSRLRLIQALGSGVDTFDTTALPSGCTLCNVGEHEVPIAEYAMGAMVALTVGFARRDRELRQGNWEGTGRRDGLPHQELAGRTLGLLGYGGIGVEIAKRARAFDMRIHAVRANPKATNGAVPPDWLGGPHQLKSLLESSDYLAVCCPLTAETRELLNTLTLGWLKAGAYLVNVARAEVIEETALFEALKSRRIAAAALDVWRQYPENAQQRLLPSTLPFHELDNVLLTPHLAAWTEAMMERRWRRIAKNLDALAENRELQNVVFVNSPVSV